LGISGVHSTGMRTTKPPAVRTVVVERHFALSHKKCLQCGKDFMGTKKAQYCSRTCTRAASYQRHAEERRAHRREVYQQEKAAKGKAPRRRKPVGKEV
jgi:hypothetical protein